MPRAMRVRRPFETPKIAILRGSTSGRFSISASAVPIVSTGHVLQRLRQTSARDNRRPMRRRTHRLRSRERPSPSSHHLRIRRATEIAGCLPGVAGVQIVPTNAVAGAQARADAGEGAAVAAAMASVARRIMHESYAIAPGCHHSHASPNRHDDRHLDRNPA